MANGNKRMNGCVEKVFLFISFASFNLTKVKFSVNEMIVKLEVPSPA